MGLERTVVAPAPSRSEDGLGGYLFGHHLGQSGDVYEAEHPRFQGRLALKMFRRSTGVGTAAVDAFSREAGRVSILRHPHIVQVMEAGALRDGTPFVSMELLSGQTLDELLVGRGALMASELLPLVRGIASALTAAHAAGIIHREIRPDNVFVVTLAGYEHGFVKVLDFGVSRLTVAERSANGGTGVRAPSYLAPEQVAGRIEDITEAADQFALGALTYRLLSGSDPFVAHARPRGLERVGDAKAGVVAPLARRAPAVDAVVSKAMSRHPGDRFQSVALFFRAFEEALAGSALISTPMPAVMREASAGQPTPGPAGATPFPLVPPVEHEPSRRTLFGPLPSIPHAAPDLPTREIPLSRGTDEATPPPDPSEPPTPAPVVAAPRHVPVPEQARSLGADGHVPQRHRPGGMQDDVTISQQFFYEGERQETERIAHGHPHRDNFAGRHQDFESYDRVPKRRAPMFLAVLTVLACAAGGAWWMGWRPPQEWQESEVWKTLRLPPIPPAPASHQPPVGPAAPAAIDDTATPTPVAVPAPAGAEPPPAVAGASDAANAGVAGDAVAPAAGVASPPPPAAPVTKPSETAATASRERPTRKAAASGTDRKANALHGFVWSPSERAFVPAPSAAPSASPAPSSDEPLPFPR